MHNAPIRLVHACKHARSHTRRGANLRWSDILLHQQVGRWVGGFYHVPPAAQRVRSLDHPPCRRSAIPRRATPRRGPLVCCHLQQPELHAFGEVGGARSAWLLLDSPRRQSVTLARVLHGPSSWCCTRPKRQGWTRTCQRHLHSCHPLH